MLWNESATYLTKTRVLKNALDACSGTQIGNLRDRHCECWFTSSFRHAGIIQERHTINVKGPTVEFSRDLSPRRRTLSSRSPIYRAKSTMPLGLIVMPLLGGHQCTKNTQTLRIILSLVLCEAFMPNGVSDGLHLNDIFPPLCLVWSLRSKVLVDAPMRLRHSYA